MNFRHIKFQHEYYILIGVTDGTITTERLFREGSLGVAYLQADGVIMRDGEMIGTKDDIEFGECFTPSPLFVTPILN